MEAQEKESLRAAVTSTLRSQGTSILLDPKRFVGGIADVMGTVAPGSSKGTVTLLMRTCDGDYLGHFATAAEEGTPEALKRARYMGQQALVSDYMMREDAASDLSDALACGIADFLGVRIDSLLGDADGRSEVVPGDDVPATPAGMTPPRNANGPEVASATPAGSVNTKEAAPAMAGQAVNGPAPAPAYRTNGAPGMPYPSQPASAKKKGPLIAIVAVLVVAMGVAGAGIALGWFGRGTTPEVGASSSGSETSAVAQEPDAALAGKTSVGEDELDLLIATYKFKGEPRQLTVREVIKTTSSLEDAKDADGKYKIPSSDNVLSVIHTKVMVEEAEARGINPTDEELLDFAEETYGLTPDFEAIANTFSIDVDTVKEILRQAYMTNKLQEGLVGKEPEMPDYSGIEYDPNSTEAEEKAKEEYEKKYEEYSKTVEEYQEKVDKAVNELYAEDVSDVRLASTSQ